MPLRLSIEYSKLFKEETFSFCEKTFYYAGMQNKNVKLNGVESL